MRQAFLMLMVSLTWLCFAIHLSAHHQNEAALTDLDVIILIFQDLQSEVHGTITCSFWTDVAATPLHTAETQHTGSQQTGCVFIVSSLPAEQN